MDRGIVYSGSDHRDRPQLSDPRPVSDASAHSAASLLQSDIRSHRLDRESISAFRGHVAGKHGFEKEPITSRRSWRDSQLVATIGVTWKAAWARSGQTGHPPQR